MRHLRPRSAIDVRRLRAILGVACAASVLAIAAAALASTGALTNKGCIADAGHNPAACAKTAKGLSSPYAVAVSEDGKSVYVTGAGDNAIVHFQRSSSGALTWKGCIAALGHNPDGCTKTAPGLREPLGVAISRDGKSVYAVGLYDDTLVHLQRDTTTGALTDEGCIGETGDNPAGCATTAKGLYDASGVAITRDGKSVYLTSDDPGALVHFQRNTSNGALTYKGCVGDPDNSDACPKSARIEGAGTPVISKDGKWLYLASWWEPNVTTFQRNTSTGALTRSGCIGDSVNNDAACGTTAQGLGDPMGLALTADGKSLYATSPAVFAPEALAHLKRSRTTGALTPEECIGEAGHNTAGCPTTAPGLGGASGVVASPDSSSVYVAGSHDNAIARFARDQTTGVLTEQSCRAAAGHNPAGCGSTAKGLRGVRGLAISPDGASLYATGGRDSAVARFNRSP